LKRVERTRGALKYTFDHRHVPVLEVEQGESFVLETEDAPSGCYRKPEDAAHLLDAWYLKYSPAMANPVTGPVFIRGAEAGDTVIIEIENIELDEQSVTYWRLSHWPLGDSARWQELGTPTMAIGRHANGTVIVSEAFTMEDGEIHRHPLNLQFPQSPFIGTLAVAPEREVATSGLGQGSWGGNMDVRDIRPGARVLIPCYHNGALLYVGDVHACQGDTEFYGTAMETRSAVTLRCEVIKGKNRPFVRIEKDESLIALACAKPLEEAVWRASTQLMEWLIEDYGCSQREAYLLLGVNPDFRVNVYQMAPIANLQFTAGAEIMKKSIPGFS